MAVGSMMLSNLSEIPSIFVLGKDKKTIEQKLITEKVSLFPPGDPTAGRTAIAEVSASVILQNLGDSCVSESLVQNENKNNKGKSSNSKLNKNRRPLDSGKVQAALELELWKDAQEKLFEKQLKCREIEHMEEMANEWHRRDQLRQQILSKKIEEYAALEEELRSRLAAVEKREVDLRLSERELDHLRKEVARYKDLRNVDLQEAAKRMEDEAHHRIALEKLRARQFEEEIVTLKMNIHASEEKSVYYSFLCICLILLLGIKNSNENFQIINSNISHLLFLTVNYSTRLNYFPWRKWN